MPRRLAMRQLLALVVGLSVLGGSSVIAQFQNDAYDKVERGLVVQTFGNTPEVIYSMPAENFKVVFAEAFIVAVEHTYAAGAAAKIEGLFARREAALGQVGTTRVDLIHTTFAAPQPLVEFVVNNSAPVTESNPLGMPTVDVRVTGKAGMTIQWYLDFKARKTK